MKLDEYQELSRRTIPTDVPLKELTANFSMGMCGESGECSELLKKHLFHGHALSKEELEKELGDVLFYVTGLATLYGIKLSSIAETNRQKLLSRYPEGFDTSKSVNRVEYA